MFRKRLLAFIIDNTILSAIYLALAIVILFSSVSHIKSISIEALASASIDIIMIFPLFLIANWLYFAILESSSTQATVGKMLLKLRLVNESGMRITFLQASIRHFSKLISQALLCIGYLMIIFTKEKRALHDFLANCQVIKA